MPPFRVDPVGLGEVLEQATEHNADLAVAEVDVEISEARILGAVGAYDVQLSASLDLGLTEFPQRGSQLAIALGSRRVGGGVGLRRALETGGELSVQLQTMRTRSDQPTDISNPQSPTATLTGYTIAPSLQFSHSLLRGAGLKVNRAPIAKAKIARTAAEAARLSTAQTVALDIITAYWDLLYAHRNLANKHSNVEQVRRQLDVTARLVKAGRRSALDAKVVRQGLAAREAEVLAAEQTLLQTSLRVRGLMGDRVDSMDGVGLLPTTDPVVEARAVVIEDEIARALEANPDVRQAELMLASGHIDARVAKNGKLPGLEFESRFAPQGRSVDTLANPTAGTPGSRSTWGGAFGNMFNGEVAGNGVLADWTLSGTVTLTWDVQNRRAKGAHEEAVLSVERAELLLDNARRGIASQVIEAASGLRTAGKMIDVAQLSYELAVDNLDAEKTRYGAGRATNYDVLLRLDEVDKAAAEALRSQVDYLKALAQLQALNGELLPAYGLTQ